jgi:hypothetical protein
MNACEESGQTFLSKAIEAIKTYNEKEDTFAGFSAAYLASPLKDQADSSERTSGNENRTGVFVMP